MPFFPISLSPSALQRLGAMLCLVLATLAVYANAYSGAFVLDDEILILRNRYLSSWDYLGAIFTSSSSQGSGGIDSFYRPLQNLLYLVVAKVFGIAPEPYHALNILLHTINSLLMFRLGEKLGFNRIAVFAASLLWVVHPIHTEAVTYISATADTLYTLFVLSALLVMPLQGARARQMLPACGFFVLAILSKETSIILPALAVVCMYVTTQNPLDWKNYKATWPLWAVALIYFALRLTILKLDGLDFYKTTNIFTENPMYRISTFFATLLSYAKLIVLPEALHMETNFPVFTNLLNPTVWIGIGFVTLAITLFVRGFTKPSRASGFGAAWFFIAHALHTNIVLPVNAIFLEHWMYLPMLGLFLGTAQALYVFLAKQQQEWSLVAIALVLPATVALGVATHEQNKVWLTPLSFYNHILKYEQGSARVHNNIAMAYGDIGKLDAMFWHYNKAIETEDSYAQTRYNLANAMLQVDQSPATIDKAIVHYQRALEIRPGDLRSCKNLADIYRSRGDTKNADFYQTCFETTRKRLFPEMKQ